MILPMKVICVSYTNQKNVEINATLKKYIINFNIYSDINNHVFK